MAEEVEQYTIQTTFSVAQNWGFTVMVVLTSLLSVFGSSCILWFARLNHTWQQKLPYQRLVAGLAIADILFSIGSILQPFAVPHSVTVNVPMTMWIGGYTTCSITGVFFWSFIATSTFYNACLSANFVLVVVFNWTSESMVHVFERAAHGFAWLWPMSIMIPAALTQSISPQDRDFPMMCVVDTFPSDCTESEDIDCLRGESFAKLFRAILFGTIFLSAISGIFGALWVYVSFRRQVGQSVSHSSFATLTPHRRTLLEEATTRCLSYMFVYTNSFFWLALGNILQICFDMSERPGIWYVYQLLAVGFIPLQGFFNMIVYIRPYVVSYRQRADAPLNVFSSFFYVLTNKRETAHSRETFQRSV